MKFVCCLKMNALAVEKVRFRSIALDLKEKVSYNLAYEHVL